MSELGRLLQEQLDLQINSFGIDPRLLVGRERADFVRSMMFALDDELHEAADEIKWKPWLTDGSQGDWINREYYVGELVDAFHFFVNLLLVAGDGPYLMDGDELADEFIAAYQAKKLVNAKRQAEGYDGVKDADGREVDRPVTPQADKAAIMARDTRNSTPAEEHLRLQAEAAAAETNGEAP